MTLNGCPLELNNLILLVKLKLNYALIFNIPVGKIPSPAQNLSTKRLKFYLSHKNAFNNKILWLTGKKKLSRIQF